MKNQMRFALIAVLLSMLFAATAAAEANAHESKYSDPRIGKAVSAQPDFFVPGQVTLREIGDGAFDEYRQCRKADDGFDGMEIVTYLWLPDNLEGMAYAFTDNPGQWVVDLVRRYDISVGVVQTSSGGAEAYYLARNQQNSAYSTEELHLKVEEQARLFRERFAEQGSNHASWNTPDLSQQARPDGGIAAPPTTELAPNASTGPDYVHTPYPSPRPSDAGYFPVDTDRLASPAPPFGSYAQGQGIPLPEHWPGDVPTPSSGVFTWAGLLEAAPPLKASFDIEYDGFTMWDFIAQLITHGFVAGTPDMLPPNYPQETIILTNGSYIILVGPNHPDGNEFISIYEMEKQGIKQLPTA